MSMHLPKRMNGSQITARGAALLIGLTALALALNIGGCPQPHANNPDDITKDTTLTSLNIAAGKTITVTKNAVVTVNGDATINGTLSAPGGRLTLHVTGNLTINGTLSALQSPPPDLSPDTPFDQQALGIFIVIGDGGVTFGDDAHLETNGSIVVTDDNSVLQRTPTDVSNEIENVSADNLPTIVPLPPDNDVFKTNPKPNHNEKLRDRQQPVLGPINIGGVWPPAGAAPPAGDRPVIIFRFNGARDLNLNNWTVNGPPAPPGADKDESDNAGNGATGGHGKNGMNLNIWNNGGRINVNGNVVLNLPDGGDGGNADSVCSTATGGNGGKAGNFRMTGAGGIDLSNGTLTINPGKSGSGGDATVTKGEAAAGGCPGDDGSASTATGGNAANNEKRLLARGDVAGVENVTIGELTAGDGGNATATACDGGPGDACCYGGDGGPATATGGKGGNASLNLSGLSAASGGVNGGRGGDATATGGIGGKGGDCKFFDGGDGGTGGNATATGGAGGSATTTGGGAATGGDGGDATATGGDGGAGGDSGFGTPGAGGPGGTATATPGGGGSGTPSGTDGQQNQTDGDKGPDGVQSPITIFCFGFTFVLDSGGVIAPGVQTGPLYNSTGQTQVGTMSVDFVAVNGAQYFTSGNPVKHIGLQNGAELDVRVSTLTTQNHPGHIGGVRLATLYGTGLSESNPLTVQALDANGAVIGTQHLASVPDNLERATDPVTVDVLFGDTTAIATFRITAPPGSFVTIILVYILDP